jgi:hypothetical protein
MSAIIGYKLQYFAFLRRVWARKSSCCSGYSLSEPCWSGGKSSSTSQVLGHGDFLDQQFLFCLNPQPQVWTELLKGFHSYNSPRSSHTQARRNIPQLSALRFRNAVRLLIQLQISLLYAIIDRSSGNLFQTPGHWRPPISVLQYNTDSATDVHCKAFKFYLGPKWKKYWKWEDVMPTFSFIYSCGAA